MAKMHELKKVNKIKVRFNIHMWLIPFSVFDCNICMICVKKKGTWSMEFTEKESYFNLQIQIRRIRILKKILGIEDCDLDISEFELQNIIEEIL